ncbi:hypothetical protein COS31_05455 [Candidatus Roizmanbacteria bacterium CG02_land_8_20_14_3_00_36_15]|uniref:Cell shape-determining protein MreB n=1 Tax=Candidatus Roizmanbacteria bacterium CG10_big_fil_rev_8_21_14_0_10_36_26 TaxID=1974851 RepID=A0A2M8KM97_9BACT|nr:MAG: hypothetical protein COS51_01135 [Candidatus Roizmanbacteria bacterium CG03_land_8_20_14_0_80_36_21]PIV37256.1 MAG: hypothetical protein COS31_05455 [Candidatus Roizmanbacteria bacterium CG02_land_8_20_14_3_00_36_15]PIY70476.1 MAG: hypothetical protein COY89_00955 [Candidatus Roizmanbacteria bacterium CG_4_10_14_0_8_um_filter_36_36]PJA53596.1 MAG: hypothetical protein CO166_01270 [Candidatus Roizmanbacteria bacterium CG_4_9_14_3_um_filter_36_11]PJE61056.1 MAG: hypothetical protein COU86
MFNFIENLKKLQRSFLTPFDVYFDFGTTNTRIAIKDRGVVLRQPTVIGLNTKTKEYIFFGNEAKKIIGKTPDFIQIIHPIVNSIISNFDAQLVLIEYLFSKSVKIYLNNFRLLKPFLRAIAAVPYSATEIEKKAVEEVLFKLNFSSVFLIEKPVANAAGVSGDILSHHPILIVDLGGGLIEAAIISGGGIVSEKTLRTAGEGFGQILANYLYLKHGIILGDATCDLVKTSLLNFQNEEKIMTVRGKSLETGLPKSIRLKSSEIKEALFTSMTQIIDIIKELMEIAQPEIVDEIYTQGVVLTGGLANVKGIETFIAKEIKIKVNIATNPSDVTINGIINIGKNQDQLSKLTISPI